MKVVHSPFLALSWAEEMVKELMKGSSVEMKTRKKHSKDKTDSNLNV